MLYLYVLLRISLLLYLCLRQPKAYSFLILIPAIPSGHYLIICNLAIPAPIAVAIQRRHTRVFFKRIGSQLFRPWTRSL